MRASRTRSVLFSIVSGFALTISTKADAQTDSLAATTINDDQMKRGFTVFNKVCLECHTKSDITGADFKIKWTTRPVFDLFNVIHTTMPDNAPGTLSIDQYLDVVAYLLRVNGAPGGGAAIAAGDTLNLKKLKIEIVVPAPSIDSLLNADTTKVKTDTTKAKTDTLKLKIASTHPKRVEAIMTRPFRAH
ncbi:MAG: c-type cytochrome [Gemmatimonadaceae bacterium]